MKSIAAVVLVLGLGGLPLVSRAQDKKDEKKDDAKTPKKEVPAGKLPNLEGKYTLVSGKLNDKPVDDDAKKWDYTFTAERITIASKDEKGDAKKDVKPLRFAMGYKLDASETPIHIDLEILDGPEGTKGSKALGIIEVKGDTLRLAYLMDKEKRPTNFEGKEGNAFELKKSK